MFGNILGRKKDDISKEDSMHIELESKISKMNLTDMRAYIKGSIKGFEPCEDGLIAVLNKLLKRNEETSKRYIELDDMDSKKKKGFDLVITLCEHKKITVRAVELVQDFIELYKDVIERFDTENKQIYGSRLKSAIETSVTIIGIMTEANRKAKVLSE